MITKAIRFLVVNMLCCFAMQCFANETDSLQRILAAHMDDSTRVNVLNELSKAFSHSNPDSAIIIAGEAKTLAEKNGYKAGLALACKNSGMGYYLQGKYKEAVLAWQEAATVYQESGDKAGVANMLNNQGAVYFNQGDDAKALELYLNSLKLSEAVNDTVRIVTALNNIGGVYLNKQATYSKALEYFLRSYKLSIPTGDPHSIGTAAVNLGETYYKIGNDSTALVYLRESEKLYKEAEPENLPYTLNYIGRVYTRQKQFDKAIEIHKQAYQLSQNLDTKLDQAQSLVAMAQAYQSKGDVTDAIDAYKKAVDIGQPLNAITEIKDAYEGLSAAYSTQNDFTNAYKYQNLLLAVKDSIYNFNTTKKLGTLQFGFDMDKKESEIKIKEQEIKTQKLIKYGFIGGFGIMLLFAGVFFAQRNRIRKAKKRSDELLLNILPEETAEELKATGMAKTKSLDLVTVLFTDFKNFTVASEKLTPEELVAEINHCYSAFDRIVEKYGVEKIKTIGDSYMCAGGLPVTNTTHPFDIVSAGLEMVQFIEDNKNERIAKGQPYFELRCGIHTGPVVAGIVGIKKFAYDIWGDTVNTASRMESSGGVGKVNISGATYEMIKGAFACVYRGKIEAKNKGSIDMYFVEGRL
jgi:adenylate cyclase